MGPAMFYAIVGLGLLVFGVPRVVRLAELAAEPRQ